MTAACQLSPAWRQRVEAAYAEPHRHYHTMEHLQRMWADAAPFAPLPRAVEWAIWFHDFVYDPRSAANEENSAVIARTALAEMGENGAVIERTSDLIMATRHGAGAATGPNLGDDAALLVSLDLAILAAPAAVYDAYVAQVRAEYAHVPEEQFRAGRAAFMRQLLAAPVLFPHPAFASHQLRARDNIRRELC